MYDPRCIFANSEIGSVRKRVQDLDETAMKAQSRLALHCGHLKGKGLTSWYLFVMFIVIFYFPIWHPKTGVVLDCIDS